MAQLSPPWYTLWNEIKATLGNAPNVEVMPLDTTVNPYVVTVKVGDHDQAVAMASITAPQYVMGNITIKMQVQDNTGAVVAPVVPKTAEDLAGMVKKALGNNPWFVGLEVRGLTPMSGTRLVYIVFKADIVQFFNDDLSDLYNNYNNVVAFCFRDVLNSAPGGIPQYPSTALK